MEKSSYFVISFLTILSPVFENQGKYFISHLIHSSVKSRALVSMVQNRSLFARFGYEAVECSTVIGRLGDSLELFLDVSSTGIAPTISSVANSLSQARRIHFHPHYLHILHLLIPIGALFLSSLNFPPISLT